MIKNKLTLCIRLTPARLTHVIRHFFAQSLVWVWEGFTIVSGIKKKDIKYEEAELCCHLEMRLDQKPGQNSPQGKQG